MCDFLLVLDSNLGPILHRFGDIAGFCAHDPISIQPNFGVFPLYQIGHVGVSERINLKLISRDFRSIPTCVITVPERHRRTDGHTKMSYCGITALCVASRGKSELKNDEIN